MTTNRTDDPTTTETASQQIAHSSNDLPEPTSAPFPIVGIGASAGGLAAFEAFFSGMPTGVDPGMAFILVQHLAPNHKSILTDLVQRYTRMQVFEVEDGMAVRPNCTYIIPPSRDMILVDGHLQLSEPSAPRGLRLPIDVFFRSLAADQRERAICIVLSGTGSDGSLGIRAVKSEGGMVMAQHPDSTEYNGMPRSAIATGLVDYQLLPAEMAPQLIAYVTHAFGTLPRVSVAPPPQLETEMKKIFALLHGQTGHDFSQYKRNTIRRRIERRMAVHQLGTMDGYVKHAQRNPAEVDALFRDLLIGVTSFFRDPEAFKALEEEVIPMIFAGKPSGGIVRVWSPGCSTGEEAYSLAILLQERVEALKQNYRVQVFATDIDSHAIFTARTGVYPASIAADITPERLSRFFSAEPDGSAYRIHKGIRDMLVLSEQDVIKDPPFSKLDLICCRNLLIYLNADLQKKLIPLFHYALNPNGVLFMGTSETIGEFADLFGVMDRKLKLYQRRADIHSMQRTLVGRFLPPLTAREIALLPNAAKVNAAEKLPLRELTEQTLLLQAAPASALVNAQGDILYLHGRTGMFLEPTPGEAGINNILKMARPGLLCPLTTTLHKAVLTNESVRQTELRVKTNGDYSTVNLAIFPVATASASGAEVPLYLVTLEIAPHEPRTKQAEQPDGKGAAQSDNGVDARIEALKQELQAKEQYLQTTNEELETSNEELKSSNEEMQSVNEELQSTNEELETSKEELQSMNEELATVNAELQTKLTDLSRINNDMNNLLAGTGIATVFVDHQLRILRFTPAATHIINLILSDVGRPLGHIVSNLVNYDRLVTDAKNVLDTLVSKEVEVQTQNGAWFTMRILPYRTLDNVIEGAVITFIEITTIKRTQDELRESDAQFRTIFEVASVGIVQLSPATGQILRANEMFCRLTGFEQTDLLKLRLADLTHPDERHRDWDAFYRAAQGKGADYLGEKRIIRKDGRSLWIKMNADFVRDANGQSIRSVAFCEDITERRAELESLRSSIALLQAAQRMVKTGGWEWDVAKQVMRWTEELFLLQDLAPGELEPNSPERAPQFLEGYLPGDRTRLLEAFRRCADEGQPYDLEFEFTTVKGRKLRFRNQAEPVREGGKTVRIIGTTTDISTR